MAETINTAAVVSEVKNMARAERLKINIEQILRKKEEKELTNKMV